LIEAVRAALDAAAKISAFEKLKLANCLREPAPVRFAALSGQSFGGDMITLRISKMAGLEDPAQFGLDPILLQDMRLASC
jgi:hypothetical protein